MRTKRLAVIGVVLSTGFAFSESIKELDLKPEKLSFLPRKAIETVAVTRPENVSNPLPDVDLAPDKKGFGFNFRVLTKNRNQLGYGRTRNPPSSWNKHGEVISLDFNYHKGDSMPMVVLRNNPSPELVKAAQAFVKAMCDEYGLCSISKSGRYGRAVLTRSEWGRGVEDVTHVEPFNALDKDMVDTVAKDPEKYAKILAQTFGSIPGPVTFIPPHYSNNGGATSHLGNESSFAKKYVIPELMKITSEYEQAKFPADLPQTTIYVDLSEKDLWVMKGGKEIFRYNNIEWSRKGLSTMSYGIGGKPRSYKTPLGEFTIKKEPYHDYGRVLRVLGESDDGYTQDRRGILIHRDNTKDRGSNGCIHVGSRTMMNKLYGLIPADAKLVIRR